MAEHNELTGTQLHEPKGVASADEGTVYTADGAGSGVWQAPTPPGTLIGFFDYADLATQTTPISVVGGSSVGDLWTYLPNDALGANTNKTYRPAGVNDVWDAATGKFDWEDLILGDMVDLRLDVTITTTSANQSIALFLEMATDSGTPYNIPFAQGIVKTAGTNIVNQYNGVYMGSSSTLNNRARFKVSSDANATVTVNGWYCKVLINR